MHDYDVHEFLYLNCGIYDPCVGGSGQYGHVVKLYLIFKKRIEIPLLQSCEVHVKLMDCYYMHCKPST